jgi:hypothetical protein
VIDEGVKAVGWDREVMSPGMLFHGSLGVVRAVRGLTELTGWD